MKKIMIIVLMAVFAAACVVLCYPFVAGLRFRKDELLSCSVSTGGGMNGGYRNLSLRREKDGTAVLEVRWKETHADREATTVYRVEQEAFANVRDIVGRCSLYAASRRPYSKIQVLDGETTTESFDFRQGDFRISDNQVLSRKMTEGFREVNRYLESLATGDGVTTLEPQEAMLYLKSGYTLRFIVADAFDGKLNGILDEEREVSAFGENGIILRDVEELDVSAAEPVESCAAGTIVYDGEGARIILLYTDYAFGRPVYELATLDDYVNSACPLIAEMEGEYRLVLN